MSRAIHVMNGTAAGARIVTASAAYSCNPYGESLLRDECRLQLQSLWRVPTA